MRILLTKISDDRHALEIRRKDGRSERVELETKSLLRHDLLHYAVESSVGMQDGFWGALAAGKSLADMNDRTGERVKEYAGTMGVIEPIIGMLSSVVWDGVQPADFISSLQRVFEAQGKPMPEWLTLECIDDVKERMRQLLGYWKATPFGGTMEIEWNESIADLGRGGVDADLRT